MQTLNHAAKTKSPQEIIKAKPLVGDSREDGGRPLGGGPWGKPLGEAPEDQIQALFRPDNVLCVCNIHKYPAFSV